MPRAARPPAAVAAAVTRRNLSAITWDGISFSVMVGAGEKNLQAFAVALGHGDLATGFVATLPTLMGCTLQLASPWAVAHIGSQKRWVIGCSALQTLSWIPLLLGAAMAHLGVIPLFAAITIYWATGFGPAPAWTGWVETLVPERLRGHYFGRRSALCQAATFLGIVVAGALLHRAEAAHAVLPTFAVIFALALVARAGSTFALTFQTEPQPLPAGMEPVPLHTFVARLRHDRALRLLFCILPLQFAVSMGDPFFTPYVLKHLDASYATNLLLIAVLFLGKVAVLPTAGRLAHRVGARRILWMGSIGLVPVPALWTLSNSFAWLAFVQVASGFAWACFELGTFLVFFEAVPPRERTSGLAAYYFLNALAAALGSLAGGAVLDGIGTSLEGYVALFGACTVARVAAVPFLAPLRR